jgi:hypothetical protein
MLRQHTNISEVYAASIFRVKPSTWNITAVKAPERQL